MGYMRHHAIVVTSWNDELVERAHVTAQRLFPWVSPLSPHAMNRNRSFFVPPDGSKEGWEDSMVGDRCRDTFVEYLNSLRYEDGSTAVDWVEVQYGDDEKETVVTRHSDLPIAARSPASS